MGRRGDPVYCLLILLLFAALCRWYGDARCYLYGNEVPVCVIRWGGGGDPVYCLLIFLLFAALCRWYMVMPDATSMVMPE